MEIKLSRKFDKSYKKLIRKVQDKFSESLIVFEKNPFDSELRNHALSGKYEGHRSIDITGDYRAIFIERPSKKYEFVEFINIGTHSQLY